MSDAVTPAVPAASAHPVLAVVLRAVAPLVRWLVRSGVGYTEFAAALKPVFLQEARDEARRTGGKTTDSALSLLSGLHRKDVRRASQQADAALAARPAGAGRASLPAQVVTRWLANDWPDALPLAGPEPSFEALVRAVSTDVHPRTVWQELLRLGVAEREDDTLRLQRRAFVPDPAGDEARQLLADGVADHLSAGVHNLTAGPGRKYLEQAVFADGLTPASVRELEQLANRLWADVLRQMVQAAVPLCARDEALGGDQRLRLGLYCYAGAMETPPATTATQTTPAAVSGEQA